MTNAAQSSETPAFSFSLAVASEEAIARLMADLALLLMPGDTIALSGGLGAGKTTCARALIRQLAGDPVLDVPSPTFTLIQSYDLPQFTLLHADLYRITSPREIDELDLFDNDPRNVRLIEWPEHAGNALPHDRIDIALSHHTGQAPSRRDVTLTGTGLGAARVERLSALLRFLICRCATHAACRRCVEPLLCAHDVARHRNCPRQHSTLDEFAAQAGWPSGLSRQIL